MDEKEYIEREAALAVFHDWIDQYGDVHTADEIPEYEAIENLPAADVEPVRHGEWVYNSPEDNIPYCSECLMPQDSECNFCPSCGAKMDGRNNNG
jgi:hypothetical protein